MSFWVCWAYLEGMSTTISTHLGSDSDRIPTRRGLEDEVTQDSGVDEDARSLITEAAQQAADRLGPLSDEHVRLVRHILENRQSGQRG